MPSQTAVARPRRARKVPVHRTIPRLIKDPIPAFEDMGRQSGGEIVRLDLGLFRPYLLVRPEHVHHVLRDNNANYVRDGMFWKPLRRLLGNGILGFGPQWRTSRSILQPLFTAKHINSMMGHMTQAIGEAVDGLAEPARSGQPVEATVEMTRVVHRAVSRVFFGDRITPADFDALAPAIDTAASSVMWRMLMPFVPQAVPMPGDRAFKRSVRTINQVMMPIIGQARREDHAAGDIVSTLCHARDEHGTAMTDRAVCDDVVAMFSAGTETTAVTLSWLWVVLRDNPDVAARLCEEIRTVVGPDRVTPDHLTRLPYTRMVIQELIRLYAAGWVVPRQAVQADVIDGVRIPAGATIIISPYVSQRMPWLWDDPHRFDPERFSPERVKTQHRYAYFPFGGGPHQCVGNHFFLAEAQAIVANVLSRFQPEIIGDRPVTPRPAASLRPRQRIDMVLRLVPTPAQRLDTTPTESERT